MDSLTTLVIAAQRGDLDAFGEIVIRFQDMAYAGAYAWLGDFHLAQDVAQEAFIDAYLSLPNLREPAAFPGWFRKIILKHGDRISRRKQVATVPIETASQVSSTEADPAVAVEVRQMKQTIYNILEALPEHQRLVTTLFYITGYSQKEIADFLDVPVSTVKKRLYDARKRLHDLSNDPPTLHQRLVRTGLALAEAFREQGCQEGVLVIEGDLALADQLAGLEELVGITSIGAISTLFWGLWDEIKQKAKGTFAQLDTVITFDPGRGEQRLYPAIDPLRSTSTILDLQVVGETHVKIAQQMRALLKQYNNLRETVETQGLDTLSGEDRQVAIRARRLQRFLTQPFFVAEPFTATPGKYVSLAETLKGCQALLDGQYDNLPEEAFYFVGTIEEAIEKARD